MAQKEDREIAKIKGFLAEELTELGVKRRAKRLLTSPKEIAKHTGFDVETVKKWLSRAAGRRVEGKLVVVRAGKTDVVVRLASRAPCSK